MSDTSQNWHRRHTKGGLTHLPRQDQLWKMLPLKKTYALQFPHTTCNWQFAIGSLLLIGKTPEQALIQGVMHELHNKVWDGERWVKK